MNKNKIIIASKWNINKKEYLCQRKEKEKEKIEIKESLVEHLIVEDNKIKGVVLEDNAKIESDAVILTTGTYLKGMILIGSNKTPGGPHGEKDSKFLSDDLRKLGFNILRLKTGTPPRIDKNSIDYEQASLEPGDSEYHTFSFDNELETFLLYDAIFDRFSKYNLYIAFW